ncbi:MAG: fibronectin type III domain-containing protein [Bacteroidota bacterium]
MMIKTITKIFLVSLLLLAGCVESLTDTPDTIAPVLELYTPADHDTVAVGKTLVNYYTSDDQAVSFVEVYVNGKFVKRYDAAGGAQPVVYLEIDSSYMNTRISYYIKAYDGQNSTQSSVKTDILVKPTAPRLPTAPANLKLEMLSASNVLLSWDDASNELYYLLLRKEEGKSFDSVQVLSANSIRTTDLLPDPNKTYYYKVRAKNEYGYAESNTVKKEGVGGLAVPGNFKGEAQGTSKILLSWTDNSTEEIAFRIERKIASGTTYSAIATTNANTTSYLDASGLYPVTQYTYRICALGTKGQSAWSDEISVSTLSMDIWPPGNLTAVYDDGTKKVTLHWNDNSIYEIETRVERKTGKDGVYTEIGKSGVDITTYTDAAVTAGATYYYRVRGYTSQGQYSPYSGEVQISIPN